MRLLVSHYCRRHLFLDLVEVLLELRVREIQVVEELLRGRDHCQLVLNLLQPLAGGLGRRSILEVLQCCVKPGPTALEGVDFSAQICLVLLQLRDLRAQGRELFLSHSRHC